MASDFDKKLNKQQLDAVRHKKGPLLIIAGAGTGKTTVITERIKYLILQGIVKPDEVLALTFTEKAAREMEERVDISMPYGYTQMWISTFHSFCDRVLRQEVLSIGLDPNYKLLTNSETIQFIRNNLFKFKLNYFRPLGNPNRYISAMLQHFSRLQDEDVSPAEYLKWADLQKRSRKQKTTEQKLEIKKWIELADAYKAYDQLKSKNSLMDFGDLITKTLILFRTRKNILKKYQEQFKHVLVDEFQDTNFAQNELAILLAGKNKKITVVGDDDQSIYRFRGAAISNIIQFRKTYPKTKVVTLTKNYRSTQVILDKSYKLIQHNNPDRLEAVEKVDKKLVASRKEKGEVSFIHQDRVENEADAVAKRIVEIKAAKKYDYKDFAILVRANNHSEVFSRALGRNGIPYQFLGPGRLFKQSEVVDLISYLKVLYNFEDSVSFYRLLSMDHFNINPRDLVKLSNFSKRYNLSLFEGAEKLEEVYVGEDTRNKINLLLKIINKHFSLIKKETAGQLLYYFLENTGLLESLLKADTPEADKRAKNISKFFDRLKTYEVDHEDATITSVVDWIELSTELGESPLAIDADWTEIDAVNILTVHSSKGLEFPVVFLVNLVSQRFPTTQRSEQIPIPEKLIKEILPLGDHHQQEERRLFYVGMTRAKDKLLFTAANYYGEGKREKKLSPFIFESLGDEAVSSEQDTSNGEQLSFLDYKPTSQAPSIIQSPPIHIDYLSYSQINAFQICPLHYKLRYILRIPTPPNAALSFGNTIHKTLNDFYLSIKSKEKPTEKLILKLMQNNWINEGFLSKSHEKSMLTKGKKILKTFLEHEFNKNKLPLALEQPFVVPIEIGKGSTKKRLKIGGKIDRVDKLPGGRIEIIDYKTGKIPAGGQKQVDKDLQLTFYALAVSLIKQEPFGVGADKINLTLYFLNENIKYTTTRTQKQLNEAKKQIFEWKEKIETSDFKCSKHMFCGKCEFSLYCRTED